MERMTRVLFDSGSEDFLREAIGLEDLKFGEEGRIAYRMEDNEVVEVDSWVDLIDLIEEDEYLD